MIPYFAIIFLSLSSHIVSVLRNSRVWYIIYLFILGTFLCCGYMCGSDWRQYELMYNNINFNNIFYGYYAEPGFLFYMLIPRFFNVDFWVFSILTKIIQFIIFANIINRYAPEYKYFVWMFLLPKSGFYMFIDYPMRNMIAITIFLLSIKYIIGKDVKRYIICAAIAMMFHYSAIVTIPFYFILNKNISTNIYLLWFVLIFTIFSSSYLFESILIKISGLSPYILKQVEFYVLGDTIDGDGSIISVGMFLQIFFFVCLLKFRKVIEITKYGHIIFNGALIYILLYRLGLTISIFSRFQLYLVVFYVIGVVSLVRAFTASSKPLVISIICLLSCYICCSDIKRNGWKYVPYTNYVKYLMTDDLKSYRYRDNYNLLNTPYKESINK